MSYTNFKSIITLPSQKHTYKTILFYISIAYIFGFLFRLYLAYDITQSHPEYFFHNSIIPIWASDAGLYGSYAKQLIAGNNLPYDNVHMLGHILYWIYTITNLSIDEVVFYTPAILAPLISIPIILISALYKYSTVGFISGLLTSIGFNYYYRTHLGYADTDILIYTLVLFLIYSLMAIAKTKKIRFIALGVVTILMISYFYHSWKPLVFGFIFSYLIYTIIFERKYYQHYVALFFFILTMLPLSLTPKVILLVLAIFIYKKIQQHKLTWLSYPYPFYFTLIILFTSLIFMGLKKEFYLRIIQYIKKPEIFSITDNAGNVFQFSGMLQDILEAKPMPFMDSIEFISGSPFILFFSLIGIFLLIIKHRSALLLLPLLALGIFSFILGLRFSTFGVPIVFFGIVYLIFLIVQQLQVKKINLPTISLFKYGSLTMLLFFTVTKSLAYHQFITPKYTSDQAQALYNLSLKASPNDYIISFWDNGWPLWYASGLKTLTHNGKHGPDSFLIATILTTENSNLSANMSRYFLEKYNFYDNRGSIFRKLSKDHNMTKVLQQLTHPHAQLPKKTFNIYYYLNDQTVLKLPTIKTYAQIPEDETLAFTFLKKPISKTKSQINGVHFTVDTEKGIILFNRDQQAKIGNLILADGETYQYKKYPDHLNVDRNVIVYKDRYMFIMNNRFVRSFAIRNFLLNKPEQKLFEPISVTENSKILKLKL